MEIVINYESEDASLLSKRQRKKLAAGAKIKYYEKTEYVFFEEILCFSSKIFSYGYLFGTEDSTA